MDPPGGEAIASEAKTSGTAADGRRVGIVIVLYLLVTWWLSLELNVWRDEMYSLHTSAGSVGDAVRRAIEFELQPPLYFAALAVWRTASDSVFFARLLSSLFGAGAILAFVALARRLAPRIDSAYVAALLATHPFLVWAGTEVRVYALVVLLSAVLTLAFVDAYWLPRASWRRRVAFAGVALASIYTQYYLGVLFLCFGVALLARRDWRRLFAYATDLAPVALLSIPLALAIRAQLGAHRQDLGAPVAFGMEALRLTVARLETYLFSFNEAIDESRWSFATIRLVRWAYRAIIFAVVAVGLVRLRRRWRGAFSEGSIFVRSPAEVWPLVAIVGAYAVCLVALFVGMGPMSVRHRHTAGLLVPALLAVAAAPAAVLGARVAHVWTAFLVVSNVAATVVAQVVPLAKDCDCRRVAQTIAQRETAGEPILVFPWEDVMPLSVYYQGQNVLLAVPRPPSFESWDPSTFIIRSPDDISRVLEHGPPDNVGLWVHTNQYGKGWGRDQLEAFLARDYREDQRREFARGVVLRHFLRNQEGVGLCNGSDRR